MWYSVYKVDTGKLLSVASVIPPDEELQAKGVWYITTPQRPDSTKVIWDPVNLTYIPRPPDPEDPPPTDNEIEAKRLFGLTAFTQADAASAIRLLFRLVFSRFVLGDNDAWK